MYYGVNSSSSIISAVDVLQLAYQEEYAQTLKQTATTIGYMALPSLLAYTGSTSWFSLWYWYGHI